MRHDIWDYDDPAAPILMELPGDGVSVPAVAQLTKQAYVYVYDRVSGRPLWPMEERRVLASDVPGEASSPVQIVPSLPQPFDRQGFTEDDLIDFIPQLRAAAVDALQDLRMGPLFTPPSLAEATDGSKGTLVMPGSLGGANWEGGAYDPVSRTLFVPSSTLPSVHALAKDSDSDLAYSKLGRIPRVQGLPLVKPPYGRITAIDMPTGRHRWMIANGDTPADIADHEALRGISLERTGKPTRAMLLATATLLFAGEGFMGDPVFRGHDKETGEILAEIPLPATATGLPMTYLADGRQFLVVAVAGPGVPAELVALALPD